MALSLYTHVHRGALTNTTHSPKRVTSQKPSWPGWLCWGTHTTVRPAEKCCTKNWRQLQCHHPQTVVDRTSTKLQYQCQLGTPHKHAISPAAVFRVSRSCGCIPEQLQDAWYVAHYHSDCALTLPWAQKLFVVMTEWHDTLHASGTSSLVTGPTTGCKQRCKKGWANRPCRSTQQMQQIRTQLLQQILSAYQVGRVHTVRLVCE